MASPVRVQDYALPELTWNEATFQRWVKHQAAELGWHEKDADRRATLDDAAALGATIQLEPLVGLTVHHRFSLGTEAGWPDLSLFRRRDRRIVWAELKREKGRLSQRQTDVLELLRFFETGHWDCANHRGHAWPIGDERRCGQCVPLIQVFEWRPSDGARILEVLA